MFENLIREKSDGAAREKTIYNLRGNLAVKITAIVLAVLFAVTGVASVVGMSAVIDLGYIDDPDVEFADSQLCRSTASNYFYEVLWYFTSEDFSYTEAAFNAEFVDQDSNFYAFLEFVEDDEIVGEASNFNDDKLLSTMKSGTDLSNEVFFETVHSVSEYDEYDNVIRYVEIRLYMMLKTEGISSGTFADTGDGLTTARWLHSFLSDHYLDVFMWAAICVVAIIALAVFLCFAAGRRRGLDGVKLRAIDRVPLDLLTAIIGVIVFCVMYLGIESSFRSNIESNSWLIFILIMSAVSIAVACLFVIMWLMTFATRFKAGKWWRNTLIYLVICRFFIWIWKKVRWAVQCLPLIWRWVLTAGGIVFVEVLFSALLGYSTWWGAGSTMFLLLILLVFNAALLYCAIRFAMQIRELKKGGAALAQGKLDYSVDTGKMYFDFKTHGENLNSISVGMANAVDQRMKSERMKTELITNVSHDIKTPLTSIINYVDLLKKEDLKNETAVEYLEVLDRQTERLRKLTEDLIEASKATSGVVSVEMSDTDVVELLNQAVGEYEERLQKAGVTPVFTPSDGVRVMADGKLLWRVFDNLLSNICKYAMPGTRAYFSVEEGAAVVRILVRNISADAQNYTSAELMERFVRGDRSRNTEGSGLGLSISRSLVELQGGEFDINLDGDLFKIVITLKK